MLIARRVALYALVALLTTWVLDDGPVAQQVDIDAIGPRVGAAVPAFSGVDQFGRTQTLESVRGPEGTMLVFYRSADW